MRAERTWRLASPQLGTSPPSQAEGREAPMADSVKEQVGDIVSSAKRRVGMEMPDAADDEGNIGIVRGAWKAFGEGDFDKFLDAMHEDMVWEGPSGKGWPGGDEAEGADAIRKGF